MTKEKENQDTTSKPKEKKKKFNFAEYLKELKEKFKCNCTLSFD